MTHETRKKHFRRRQGEFSGGTKAVEGFGKGGAICGGVGAALAAIFAVGTSVVVPGLGLVVAGPIATVLVGRVAGVAMLRRRRVQPSGPPRNALKLKLLLLVLEGRLSGRSRSVRAPCGSVFPCRQKPDTRLDG